MNENDTERMYSLLEMSNYVPVSSPDQAELIIINSCSVREKPGSQSSFGGGEV